MLLFQHGKTLTLSVINRRLHAYDESRDVLEKVTLIKDIDFKNPHRAHIDILFDLAREPLNRTHGVRNFVELHRAWEKTLDISELNKRFFNDSLLTGISGLSIRCGFQRTRGKMSRGVTPPV